MSTTKTTTTTKNNSKATTSTRSSKPEVPKPKPSTRTPKPSNPSPSDSRKSTNTSDGSSNNSNRTPKPAGSGTPKPADGAPKSSRSSATKVEDKSRMGKSIVDPASSKAKDKVPTTKITSKTHPSHPQHILEKENRRYPFKCDGCKIRCVGERYACAPCKYNLHVDCISARASIKFQGQKCQFLERPLRCGAANCRHGDYCRSCNACGMTVKGFVYHCKEINTDFHPSCTKLKNEIRIEDVIFRLEKKGSSKCLRCQRKKLEGSSKDIPGWSYVSNHKGYTFHVHCLMDMAMLCSSKNNKGASSSLSSSSTLALNNLSIPQISSSKFKDNIGSNSLKMLEIFLKIVLPLLMGAHPATFVVSLAALGVKELVNLIFQD
ncbi:uncharacterized protein LOC141646426 [Silene latifolia]|uniref:uncharacterized protein LOC141646426 n=1 Tax=Silene latifolia TaxID=37657 RepID=UPI003D784139